MKKEGFVRRTRIAPAPREGIRAEFEHGFVRTSEGREEFLSALTSPAFVKATNEFCSAFFPGGLGCTCCQTEVLTEKSTTHKNLPKEQRWILVVDHEAGYLCHTCGSTENIIRKSAVFCHLRICRACFENEN